MRALPPSCRLLRTRAALALGLGTVPDTLPSFLDFSWSGSGTGLARGTTWEESASFAQAARLSRSRRQPGLWSARPGPRWGLPRRAVRGTSPTCEAPEPTWPRGTGHRLSWSYDRPSRRSTPVRAARPRAASSRPIVPLGAPARTISETALCVLERPVDLRRVDVPACVDILDQPTDLLPLEEKPLLWATLRLAGELSDASLCLRKGVSARAGRWRHRECGGGRECQHECDPSPIVLHDESPF